MYKCKLALPDIMLLSILLICCMRVSNNISDCCRIAVGRLEPYNSFKKIKILFMKKKTVNFDIVCLVV